MVAEACYSLMKVSGKAGTLVFSGLLLVIGMASANVLDSFGVVSGEADVEGPMFYPADDGEDYLKINEAPDQDEEISYTTIGPEDVQLFSSANVGGYQWYPVEARSVVEARTDGDTAEGNLLSEFGYTSNGDSYVICTAEVFVNSSEYIVHEGSCTGQINNTVDRFYVRYKGGVNEEFAIQSQGETRVEVNAQ
mgnify:CR=1 FL=1